MSWVSDHLWLLAGGAIAAVAYLFVVGLLMARKETGSFKAAWKSSRVSRKEQRSSPTDVWVVVGLFVILTAVVAIGSMLGRGSSETQGATATSTPQVTPPTAVEADDDPDTEPESDSSPAADRPDPLVVRPWGSLKVFSVCVRGTKQYTDRGGEPVDLRFPRPPIGIISEAFGRLGLLHTQGGPKCDATLLVDLHVTILDGRYGGRRLYTGAEVEGSVTMTAAGKPELTVPIEFYDAPPEIIKSDEWEWDARKPGDYPTTRLAGEITHDVSSALSSWLVADSVRQLLLQAL